MFHIEFIGIPGAGKSTLRDETLIELKKVDRQRFLGTEEAFLLVAKKRIDKIYKILLNSLPDGVGVKFVRRIMNRSLMQFEAQNDFLARYGEALKVFLASSEYKDLSHNDRSIVIAGLLAIGSLYQAIASQIDDSKAVIFDEGFIQKSLMFINAGNDYGKETEVIKEYLECIPSPDLLVHVKTDIYTCYERMVTRPRALTIRLKNLDRDTITKFLINSENHLKWVAMHLKNKGIAMVEIDNNLPLKDAAETLKDRLLELAVVNR